MNRYLKPARQDVPPPGGWPATRWTRYSVRKGVTGGFLLAVVTGVSFYTMLGRFKENKMMSITNMRRAEERGEQWKIVLKHFKFEDPNWRTKYYADQARRYDETPAWLRPQIMKPLRDVLDEDKLATRGGWWYSKWVNKGPIDTQDAASHGAYNELVALAKARLRRREAHKAKLHDRDGLTQTEQIRRDFNEECSQKIYSRNWWEGDD